MSVRIQRIEWKESTAWRKVPAPSRGWLRYRVLGLLSRLLKLPLLRPVHQPGGRQALQNEAIRIRNLAARGICVPLILHEAPDELVLSDIGINLSNVCKETAIAPGERLALFERVFAAVGAMHEAGCYASQCFTRNVMISDKQIGFIDFEDDPRSVLTLHQAQARDWLMLMMSSARFFEVQPEAFGELFQTHLNRDHPEVARLVRHAGSRLQWIRHLPFKKALGGDYRRIRMAIALLTDPDPP